MSECKVGGCDKLAINVRGWCNAHYLRFRRHGDPLGGSHHRGKSQAYLYETAIPYSGDGCLEWPYSLSKDGYGLVWHHGKRTIASRVVCEAVNGPPPSPEHQAAHSCGNGGGGCVNPRHIQWKTPKENHADKISHGTDQRGERSNFSKLTNSQASEILKLKGVVPPADIALMYGIDRSQVSHIHTGKNWAWLHGDK